MCSFRKKTKAMANHVFLTGMPGVGKTTLIKKVCEQITSTKISGFYTEELRDSSNTRIGFDIITLDGQREALARSMSSLSHPVHTKYKVGQYVVYPEKFEKLALPIIKNFEDGILVLDEIGKMELLSFQFKESVENILKNPKCTILGTIPLPKGKLLETVESIRNNPLCKIFQVNRSNRDNLKNEIVKCLNVN